MTEVPTSHRGRVSSPYNVSCLLKIYRFFLNSQNSLETSLFTLELFSVQSEQSVPASPPDEMAAPSRSQYGSGKIPIHSQHPTH